MIAGLVVDVQFDFLPGGALAVPRGDEVVDAVLALRAAHPNWRWVATQDWHPPGHGSFASAHDAAPFSLGELDGLPQVMWPDHCVQNTPGARLVPQLEGLSWDHLIRKGLDPRVDSYSAFFDNAKRHDTGLHQALQNDGVDEVVVMGLALDVCVAHTARHAVELGYRTHVFLPASRAVEVQAGDTQRMLAALEGAGVQLVSEADALG